MLLAVKERIFCWGAAGWLLATFLKVNLFGKDYTSPVEASPFFCCFKILKVTNCMPGFLSRKMSRKTSGCFGNHELLKVAQRFFERWTMSRNELTVDLSLNLGAIHIFQVGLFTKALGQSQFKKTTKPYRTFLLRFLGMDYGRYGFLTRTFI